MNKKYMIKLNNLLFLLLIINPLLSLFFDGTTLYYHYILLPIIFFLLVIIYNKKLTKNKIFLYFLIIYIFVITIINIIEGASIGKINNHFFNFLDFILLCYYFNDKDNLKKFDSYIYDKKNLILSILITINIVEFYYLISKKGYISKWTWGGTFFIGTSSMPHTLAYLMIVTIIICFVLYLKTSKKYFLLLSILPFFLIFESGARVVLIMSAFLGIIFVDLFFSKRSDSSIQKILKLSIFCILFFTLFNDYILNSDLMNKIIKRESSGNNSAGRMILWKDLIERFIKNPQKWLFGFGDDKVYYYSGLIPSVNVNIWAHNDYIQILFGKGIIGIVLYISSIIKMFHNRLKNSKSIYVYFIFAIFLIASILNGFYNYKDIMLSIPLIMILSDYLNTQKEVKKNE